MPETTDVPAAAAMAAELGDANFGTILTDPPWRFTNRTGKVAPEHVRLRRYETLSFAEIGMLPVGEVAAEKSHLYLWCPNALLHEGLDIMREWGFTYKTSFCWIKDRPTAGLGEYVRGRHELLLIGTRGSMIPDKSSRPESVVEAPAERHSKKPKVFYKIIEKMFPGQKYLELFAREKRNGWTSHGVKV